MRLIHTTMAACALLLTAGVCTPAAAPRDSLLVTPGWLADHLKDPNLVLLHLGDKASYDKGHIAGARQVVLDDVSVSDTDNKGNGLRLEMPPAADLRARLEKIGISDGSRIIVYSSGGTITSATRVMFTLDYAGLGDRSSLLDGGLSGWTGGGHEVTTAPTPDKPGTLSPLTTRPIVVEAKFVADHLKSSGFAVVDGRAKTFYDGTQTGSSMGQPHKTGHIAGAHSVPFTDITTDQQTLKSVDDLQALFTQAGVQPGDTIIGYCHIGQQATAMLFAARTLGHSVILYDGSFEDWSLHTDYPVETSVKKGGGGSDGQ